MQKRQHRRFNQVLTPPVFCLFCWRDSLARFVLLPCPLDRKSHDGPALFPIPQCHQRWLIETFHRPIMGVRGGGVALHPSCAGRTRACRLWGHAFLRCHSFFNHLRAFAVGPKLTRGIDWGLRSTPGLSGADSSRGLHLRDWRPYRAGTSCEYGVNRNGRCAAHRQCGHTSHDVNDTSMYGLPHGQHP